MGRHARQRTFWQQDGGRIVTLLLVLGLTGGGLWTLWTAARGDLLPAGVAAGAMLLGALPRTPTHRHRRRRLHV